MIHPIGPGQGAETAGAFPSGTPRIRIPDSLKFDPSRVDLPAHREAPPEEPAPGPKVDRDQLEKLVEEIGKLAEDLGLRRVYGLYEVTDEAFVRVLDGRTNKLIKMIPPEEFLELRARLTEAVGLLLDEEA